MNSQMRAGLARIVSEPSEQDYLEAQFLGELPAVVPSVLTAKLRTRSSSGQIVDMGRATI